MRSILAGLLVLFIPTMVFAQASGEVQNIGFGNGSYRPDCWTPMLVRLTPGTTESANYELQVWQHDLDGDRPIYTRQIVLNGSNQASAQRFWTYFLPQPIDKGLPDLNMHDLQREVQVYLCKPNHQQIAKLPITSQLLSVDPYRDTYAGQPRSSKLVLAVSSRGIALDTLDYYNKAVGAKEEVQVVNIHADELPEDPIGYEAVDAIVWLDGNPADLAAGNLDTFAALKDYVRYGGHLIVCQSLINWQEDLGFGDMLPVDVQGVEMKTKFEPLASMAGPRGRPDPFHFNPAESWENPKPPFQMARATARPGAVVNQWIDWKQDGSYSDKSPFLARKAYGLGEVTWVAQQLTTRTTPQNGTGWPYVWDKIFGWTSDGYVLPEGEKNDDDRVSTRLARYEPGPPADLGYPLVNGLNLTSKANWLILLAIVFFIVYWLVAGPGSYAYLAAQKRQALSWFVFGVSALGATLVTVAVVKLVLRGPPEIRHLSFVRVAPGQPAYVHSRFGLYIPRDGDQKINLDDSAPSSVSYLAPFAEHPQQLGDVAEFPSPTEYYVPVRDLKSDTQPQLTVAYRSSLKKFQARWIGDLPTRFGGTVQLDPTSNTRLPLTGKLTNATGLDLTDVYLAFNAGGDKDWMIYVPTWPKDKTFDIKHDFVKPFYVGHEGDQQAGPGENKILSDQIAPNGSVTDPKLHCWLNLWYGHFRRGGGDDPNIGESDFGYVYPMLSVFDRLPAMPAIISLTGYGTINSTKDRVEFYNRGARMLNASASIAAGQLVILASAKGPLPIPVEVDDNKMTGDGTVFYQFVLPMDRGDVDQPMTRPAP
jgi:hypothetical protein